MTGRREASETFDDPAAGKPLDSWAREQGHRSVAGVDEVGRGPLAGPVVAAAVILGPDHGIEGLADSKRLGARRREKLAGAICAAAEAWGFGVVGADRIDAVNIRRASLEAMSVAMSQLMATGPIPDVVLVDGRDTFPQPRGFPPLVQRPFVKADARSQTVAAASILAKVYRDALMREYHAAWPQYGFLQHKGYPTAAHKEAIRRHGPCEIHRRSFRGVKDAGNRFPGRSR